jgi:hypothetical protein
MVNQLIFRCEDKKVLSTPSNNIPRIGESVWIDDGKWHRSEYKVVDVVYSYFGSGEEIIIDLKHEKRRVVLDKGTNE